MYKNCICLLLFFLSACFFLRGLRCFLGFCHGFFEIPSSKITSLEGLIFWSEKGFFVRVVGVVVLLVFYQGVHHVFSGTLAFSTVPPSIWCLCILELCASCCFSCGASFLYLIQLKNAASAHGTAGQNHFDFCLFCCSHLN